MLEFIEWLQIKYDSSYKVIECEYGWQAYVNNVIVWSKPLKCNIRLANNSRARELYENWLMEKGRSTHA